MNKNEKSLQTSGENKFISAQNLLAKEALLALFVLGFVILISVLFTPEIGEDAGQTASGVHWRAPWIFAGIQVLLGYLPTFIAGLLIPFFILIFWSLLPVLDRQNKWQGYFAPRARVKIVRIFLLTILLIFTLIIYGTFF